MSLVSKEQYHHLIKNTGISISSLKENIKTNRKIAFGRVVKDEEVFLPVGKVSPFMFVGHNLVVSHDFFSSEYGTLISNICSFYNLDKNEIYITNIIKYFAEKVSVPDGKDHVKEFLMPEIVLMKPEVVFVFGKVAQETLQSTFHFEFDGTSPIEKEVKLKIKDCEMNYKIIFIPITVYSDKTDFDKYKDQFSPFKDLIHKNYLSWKFTHLHAHNSFSLKDGVGKPETRIVWAEENGKPAIATSNHGNICDWITVYNKSKAAGIKPILGCEFYFNRKGKDLEAALVDDTPEHIQLRKEIKKKNCHFTAFAKNLNGYYNMIRIHNDGWVNRYYRFPITAPETIEANKDGIICLSGCSGSEANRVIYDKYYLLSDKRREDIDVLLKNKIKLMKSLIRTKSAEKYLEEDDLEDTDYNYFEQHKEEKALNEDEYTSIARACIEEQDKETIASSDKKAREIIDWWHGTFEKDFYIELMVIDYEPQKIINEELIKIAKEKNIPVVITNDAHYIEKKQAKVQQLQMLNDQDKTFDDLNKQDEIIEAAIADIDAEETELDEEGNEIVVEEKKPSRKVWTIKSEEMYLKTVFELREAWEKWHKSDVFTEEVFWEGIENVVKIVDSVENYTIDKSIKLPKLDGSKKILIKAINSGLIVRGVKGNKEYEDRARYEFDIICKKNFVDYFLMVQDMVTWAKTTYGPNAVGAGRGSAAGSVINWLLGVTEVDPLKFGLMFERFLDVDREDAVDIDVDYMPNVRNDIIGHLINKYGRDSVANICTFGIAKTRVAILDVARVFGIPPQETMAITTKFDKDLDEEMSLDELEGQYPELKKYFNKWLKDKGYDMRYYVEQIKGTHRNISVHASGVLVSSNKLSENIALIRARKDITTGWMEGGDYHELSDIGYYKFDILGLSNLNVLEDARLLIKKRHKLDLDWNNIDLNDPKVYELTVNKGDHFGVFQYESALGKKVINNIKPTNFEELAAISAIIRPGPLQMGMDEEFARRKRGFTLDKDENEIPWSVEDIPICIRDILGPTLGVMCIEGSSLIITNEGPLAIEDIVNEKLKVEVLTLNEKTKELEWKKINNWYDNGVRELIELDFGETKIRCTPDHRILTQNRGWVEAQYLTEDDEVIAGGTYDS